MKIFFIIAGVVFLAEMGDKTQLGLFSLALKYRIRPVILGTLLAFSLMTLLAVFAGVAALKLIPQNVIQILAAVLFIALGLFYLLSKTNESTEKVKKGNPFWISFVLVGSAELGDKTQLLIAGLALKYKQPALVFSASLTGLALASFAGLAVVPLIKNKIGWLEKAAGLVLVLFGAWMFLQSW